MRRVLRIAMWTCWAIAVVSLIAAIVTLVMVSNPVSAPYLHELGTANTVTGFAAAFFVVLGFNALAWPRILDWANSKPTRGARIAIIVIAFVLLAILSVLAVIVLIFVVLMCAVLITSFVAQSN